MQQFIVKYDGMVEVTGADDVVADLDAHLDDVMDELVNAEESNDDISDADMSATLSTGEVSFSLVVTAADFDEAGPKGLAVIRTAIHAAGGHTHGWEHHAVAWVEKRNTTELIDDNGDLVDA
ncbi:MAG: hypothetical protein ACXIVQ_12310 [Acidimicrobiales bacterium]